MVSPEKITIEKSLRLNFSTMNNEAEYEALLKGMVMVQKTGGEDGTASARLATGNASVSWEYLGRGTPSGTMNPS